MEHIVNFEFFSVFIDRRKIILRNCLSVTDVVGEPAEFGKNRTLRISRTFRSRGVIGGRQGRGERLLHQ
ncbi:hypothetical protein, partial [Aquipseudomonas alcaligenes]|uniref:hypothetical protein n=1 Tax=Aquipseudomonas alcaligenes TaxID=43263 RepID=UPI001C7EB180